MYADIDVTVKPKTAAPRRAAEVKSKTATSVQYTSIAVIQNPEATVGKPLLGE